MVRERTHRTERKDSPKLQAENAIDRKRLGILGISCEVTTDAESPEALTNGQLLFGGK